MSLVKNLENDEMCFACGEKNPISLGLKFSFYENNKVKAEFIPDKNLQGFKDVIHGGIISTVLDEAMAQVVNMKGFKAVTAEIKVRFKKPVPLGKIYTIKGILKKQNNKLLLTEALLIDEDDTLYASSEAKFMQVER